MSISDPIADFLTRLRNAYRASHQEVSIPASNIKKRISEILKREGYIEDFSYVPDKRQGMLVIRLRYDENGKPVVKGLVRESKPSRRTYVSSDELPKVRAGLGTAVISTSRGVVTDRQARKEKIGGEYLFSVW